ncbi:MAG: peptide chain release factor N(5)-glutamine methyltransferase [Rubrivivax sp.]|nr:peptide chain release factor N(5)-glutamine methyltransferase [Rubrivivax sp.]
MSTVCLALAQARALGLDRLDAQLLMAHVLQRSRSWVLAHDDAPLKAPEAQRFRDLCARRADDVPLPYLTGEREFHGFTLSVSPAVLVPRPETEHLVDWALECLDDGPAHWGAEVADLGTGSGAVALAVARARPAARVTGVDQSPDALAVARANAQRLGLAVEWQLGDWWQPLAGRRFDLVLSNPPYVAEGDPHLKALRHEPRSALTSGPDGLDALRAIVGAAPRHLEPGAWLLLEHGHEQAEATCRLLRRAGFEAVSTRTDLAARPRCSGGRWPAVASDARKKHAKAA